MFTGMDRAAEHNLELIEISEGCAPNVSPARNHDYEEFARSLIAELKIGLPNILAHLCKDVLDSGQDPFLHGTIRSFQFEFLSIPRSYG